MSAESYLYASRKRDFFREDGDAPFPLLFLTRK